MTVTVKKLDTDNGVKWFELSGTDNGTDREFNKDIYGLTLDDTILDYEGYPLTEGDRETWAVRNSIKKG